MPIYDLKDDNLHVQKINFHVRFGSSLMNFKCLNLVYIKLYICIQVYMMWISFSRNIIMTLICFMSHGLIRLEIPWFKWRALSIRIWRIMKILFFNARASNRNEKRQRIFAAIIKNCSMRSRLNFFFSLYDGLIYVA